MRLLCRGSSVCPHLASSDQETLLFNTVRLLSCCGVFRGNYWLGAVLVFFVLAGLYESWSLPLAVVLVVPMCVLCAFTGVAVRGMDNNIFTQIGFVVLIGLACKNAILIVEFARDRRQEGASRFDAAVEAARVRLRPILMTSACFVHMVPPYFAAGAAPRCAARWAPPSCGAPWRDPVRHLPDTGVLLRGGLTQGRGVGQDRPRTRGGRGVSRDDPGRPGRGDAGRFPCEQRES